MNARELAVEVALEVPRGQSAEEGLRRRLSELPERDRGLARELLAGVIRRRASLDAIIDFFSRSRAPERLPREILRQAIYQLLFLDRIPDHAATHAAVSLCKLRAKRAAGYVNGVLRTVIRARRLSAPDHPRAFVVSAERGAGIEGLPVPDPESDLAGNLALRHSYPRALVSRWLDARGREECEALLLACNQSPPQCLRVNMRSTSREMFLGLLDDLGRDDEPGRWPPTVILERSGDITSLPGFDEGLFSVQGEAAQRAALLLDPAGARSILDLCAAPGGKATHLAELADPEASLVCVDPDERRLARLRENFARLALPEPRIVVADARTVELAGPATFDRVLVDVPCSNTAVLARRLEARWRFDPAALAPMASTGSAILEHALDLLAPGGRLLFSTCSLEPEENLELVRSVLEGRPDTRLAVAEEHLPTVNHGDGAFLALLTR